MTRRNQLVCVACGPIFLISWLLGLWAFAGFVPPPSPADSGVQTAQMFAEHRDRIKFGLLLTMIGSAFVAPFTAVLSAHLKRIEGRFSPLTYANIMLSVLIMVLLIMPMMVLQAAAFRDRSPEEARLIADLAWLPFVGVNSTVLVQWLIIGAVILQDRRADPIFPRWSGYFQFWVALLSAPAWAIYWFKSGPLAWDGLFSWWMPLTVFGAWFIVMFTVLRRAIDQDESDDAVGDAVLDAKIAAAVQRVLAIQKPVP